MDDEELWRDVLALPDDRRAVVLRHLGRHEPLGPRDEQLLHRALVGLGVEADLSPRSPEQTRAALVRVLADRRARVDLVLDPPPPPAPPPREPEPAAPSSGRRRTTVVLLAAALVVALATTVAVARRDPAATTTATPDPTTSSRGVPVAEFRAIAGRWTPLEAGVAAPEPGYPATPSASTDPTVGEDDEQPSRTAAYLEFSPYGHWRGSDGCGSRLQGYWSVTSSGRVHATMDVSGLPDTRQGCVPVQVQTALYADGRRLAVDGDLLLALDRHGEVAARYQRTGPVDPGRVVTDLREIEGRWRHTGLRGDLNSLGDALPLRDVLTVEDVTDRGEARWDASSDACIAAGGPVTVDERGFATFARTYRTDGSCSGTPGRLRWQVEQTIGMVLEDPATLLLVDDRGREVSRLVFDGPGTRPAGRAG